MPELLLILCKLRLKRRLLLRLCLLIGVDLALGDKIIERNAGVGFDDGVDLLRSILLAQLLGSR